eukprot:scaffold888_cov569-Prasinococcus_capsulatus_cf.AAC.6
MATGNGMEPLSCRHPATAHVSWIALRADEALARLLQQEEETALTAFRYQRGPASPVSPCEDESVPYVSYKGGADTWAPSKAAKQKLARKSRALQSAQAGGAPKRKRVANAASRPRAGGAKVQTVPARAKQTKAKGAGDAGRGVSLTDLLQARLIYPGEGVLTCQYKGTKFAASLRSDGGIQYGDSVLRSVSRWALLCIHSIQPDRRAVDGCAHMRKLQENLMWSDRHACVLLEAYKKRFMTERLHDVEGQSTEPALLPVQTLNAPDTGTQLLEQTCSPQCPPKGNEEAAKSPPEDRATDKRKDRYAHIPVVPRPKQHEMVDVGDVRAAGILKATFQHSSDRSEYSKDRLRSKRTAKRPKEYGAWPQYIIVKRRPLVSHARSLVMDRH